jgi:LysM repeat protein
MTSTEFTDLLEKWYIPTEDNSRGGVKWYNHNRNSMGKWGPVYGIGNHHTGADDNKAGRDVLWNGYAGLPGPLCHAGITQDGKVLLNGWGRVNHFGLGDDDVLNMVISEDYTGSPRPNEANTDGNRHFYGFEWMYDGLSNPETHYPKLYQTAVRLNAAILTEHKWTKKSSIGHGNWQPGKWDPGVAKGKFFDLVRFQGHIEQAIKEGPKKPSAPSRPTAIIVTKGMTLSGTAAKYGVTLEKLINANPQLLQPGDKLNIPKK